MKGAVIYISSNREHPEFERRVVEDMISKKGDLEVFSVTQKPMDMFEHNIVIGDVGTSGFNFCRQLQMAVESADSDYVVSCEADCLYSPDYFTFVPPEPGKVWRNTNNYVLTHSDGKFYEKDSQTAFQVADRQVLLDRLNFLLEGQPQWDTKMKNFPKEIKQPFLTGWEEFKTEYPCFGMKTSDGMRIQTRHGKEAYDELPYWGKASDIKKKFYVSD
jgi:hypothetical protein